MLDRRLVRRRIIDHGYILGRRVSPIRAVGCVGHLLEDPRSRLDWAAPKPEAHRYAETGQKLGNVFVVVA